MADVTQSIWDVHVGECLNIGTSGVQFSVEVVQKSGQQARLRISAPREVKVEKASESRAMRLMIQA